jgi:hypothetical protein
MKRPRSEIASAINPDSVLIVDEAIAREKADPRSEDEASLLSLIDGKRTVAEVLRLSKMSGFVAMRRLRSLLERQIIRPGMRVQPVTSTGGGGAPKVGRMGMTQDLTSAATSFAEQARILKEKAPAAAPVQVPAPIASKPDPRRTTQDRGSVAGPSAHTAPLPGTATLPPPPAAPLPGAPRVTPLQGTVSLPSVIITFGPDFLEPRSMPTRRLPGPEVIARTPTRPVITAQPSAAPPTQPLPSGNLVSPTSLVVPASPPTTALASLQKTSMMPRANGKRLRRRTPATSHEIEAQELWLSITRRDWRTLAVIPAHRDGSALSIATALAEAGSLLKGKPVELFSADRADHSKTGEHSTVMSGRNTSQIPLHAVPDAGLPPATEKFERVVALEPLSTNPLGATIAQEAEAVLMVAESGVTELRAAKRTVEMIGRERFIGCVLVSRR